MSFKQGEVAQSQHRTMVNEKLFQQPINSIHLETLANSGSESEVRSGVRPKVVQITVLSAHKINPINYVRTLISVKLIAHSIQWFRT